jgi:flagellar basal-body rod modification protein FlgD
MSSAISALTSSTASAYTDAYVPAPKKTTLGSDDFMKLLAVQFQSQDPMKPMEDTAFIAQMAQFSALDQSSSLVKEMALLRADQQNLSASGMLDRREFRWLPGHWPGFRRRKHIGRSGARH